MYRTGLKRGTMPVLLACLALSGHLSVRTMLCASHICCSSEPAFRQAAPTAALLHLLVWPHHTQPKPQQASWRAAWFLSRGLPLLQRPHHCPRGRFSRGPHPEHLRARAVLQAGRGGGGRGASQPAGQLAGRGACAGRRAAQPVWPAVWTGEGCGRWMCGAVMLCTVQVPAAQRTTCLACIAARRIWRLSTTMVVLCCVPLCCRSTTCCAAGGTTRCCTSGPP
jgi:hypothetical protein